MATGLLKEDTEFKAGEAKVSVPTGSLTLPPKIDEEIEEHIMVPENIIVLKVSNGYVENYIGVSSGKQYTIWYYTHKYISPQGTHFFDQTVDSEGIDESWLASQEALYGSYPPVNPIIISWSPEINKHPVNVKNY